MKLLRILLLGFLFLTFPISPIAQENQPSWKVYLGCGEAMIKNRDGAKTTVFVQTRIFGSAPIAGPCLNAREGENSYVDKSQTEKEKRRKQKLAKEE